MKIAVQQSSDFAGALKVLCSSPTFRSGTRLVRGQIFLMATVLLAVTLCGLFAIDAQARMLSFLGREAKHAWNELMPIFFAFLVLQLFFEMLQWLKRFLQNRVSLDLTISLRRRIFERYTQLTYSELQLVSAGEVTQLHSSDSAQLAGVWAEGILSFLTTLILTLGVSIFLTLKIGLSGSIFFFVLLLLVYLALSFAKHMAPVLQKRAVYSSQRLSVIQESVRAVLSVKALNAEKEFEKRICEFAHHEQEMKLTSNQISCRYVPVFASLRWFAWAAILLWVVYSPAFFGASLKSHELVALLFAVNWYSGLLQDSFLFVGTYLSSIQGGAVSALRLDAFLNAPLQPAVFLSPEKSFMLEAEVGLQNVSLGYPTRQGLLALKGVTLAVRHGQLVVVLGPVGAGKSTLLRALLGELVPTAGHIVRRDGIKVGFLSQDVVLPSASLRDVLRFEYDNNRENDRALRALLEQSEFAADLQSMPSGLDTAIGERGVTLSGGQRQRVGLAQLSYFNEADLLLLDDPLAALDLVTANLIISNLICGLWSKKTRVVTTHSVDLAARADWVVLLEDGCIIGQGPPSEMLTSTQGDKPDFQA